MKILWPHAYHTRAPNGACVVVTTTTEPSRLHTAVPYTVKREERSPCTDPDHVIKPDLVRQAARKMVVITDCDECPYFDNEYYDYASYCTKLARKVGGGAGIPAECPLETAP